MKRTAILTAIALSLIVGATFLTKKPTLGVTTIQAQSLPKTVTLAWDANSASDTVTHYVVRLDGVVVGSPTGTTQPVTITTAGVHLLSVRAVNLWAESPDTTLTVNVIIPGKPSNLRLQ
jgi:hypothetical protein